MKQKDLAIVLGISRGYLGGLVSGKRDASKKLANKLGKITGSSPDTWIFGTAISRQEAYRNVVACR